MLYEHMPAVCGLVCAEYMRDDFVEKFVDACAGGRFEEAKAICLVMRIRLDEVTISTMMFDATKKGYADILGWLAEHFELGSNSIGNLSLHLRNLSWKGHLDAAKVFVQHFKPTKEDAAKCCLEPIRTDTSCFTPVEDAFNDDHLEYLRWMVDEFKIQVEFLERACKVGDFIMVKWLLDTYAELKISQDKLVSFAEDCFDIGSYDILKCLFDRFGMVLIDFGTINNEGMARGIGKYNIQWIITGLEISKSYVKDSVCESRFVNAECDEHCQCEKISSLFTYVK